MTHPTDRLRAFGCNPRESGIYVLLLRRGPSTVLELARELGWNRITVHAAVGQLVEKGLLVETRRGKKRLLAAEPPSILSTIVDRREHELSLLKSELPTTLQLLDELQRSERAVPSVRFYEGTQGFKRMLEETLLARTEVLVFTYVDLFSKLVGEDYLIRYFKRRSAKNIHTRLIWPACPFARTVNSLADELKMQIRILPKRYVWKGGIFYWNDTIALQSYSEGRITCTVVENVDIAHFYSKVIFELMWQQALPLESKASSSAVRNRPSHRKR